MKGVIKYLLKYAVMLCFALFIAVYMYRFGKIYMILSGAIVGGIFGYSGWLDK